MGLTFTTEGLALTQTLSDKGLAGVQQDLTPLDDHPLYCQVFPNVFSLTHFIVHYPEGWRGQNQSWGGICSGFPNPFGHMVGLQQVKPKLKEYPGNCSNIHPGARGDLYICPDCASRLINIEMSAWK